MEKTRCGWVTNDPLYITYHDEEWGKPSTDARHLFEMLCLEGQQAGLSWITVLKKREAYRQAFFNFDVTKIAKMTDKDLENLLQNTGLIRHRGKLSAVMTNAQAVLAMQNQGEDFVKLIWSFAPEQPEPLVRHADYRLFPSQTTQSQQLSKALKKRGFRFVGPTTCYAFMQAVGCVDDHSAGCFCAR